MPSVDICRKIHSNFIMSFFDERQSSDTIPGGKPLAEPSGQTSGEHEIDDPLKIPLADTLEPPELERPLSSGELGDTQALTRRLSGLLEVLLSPTEDRLAYFGEIDFLEDVIAALNKYGKDEKILRDAIAHVETILKEHEDVRTLVNMLADMTSEERTNYLHQEMDKLREGGSRLTG